MKMKSKRFFVAMALLLISATLLGTASFAWFSMNTQVDVDGIEVEAYSDSLFLEISEDNSTYKTSITLTDAKATLRVVTHKTLTEGYSITTKNLSGTYVSGAVYVETSDTTAQSGKTYYTQGYVAVTVADGEDVTGLYVENDGSYTVTTDKVYVSGTKYYVPGFVAASTLQTGTTLSSHYELVTNIYVKNPATSETADTYSANNYELVTGLNGASVVEGYYKNPTITLLTSGTYNAYVAATGNYDPDVTYYQLASGSYNEVTDTAGLVEDETDMSEYFVLNSAEYYTKGEMANQNTYTKATLSDGAQLKGYYTVAGAPQYDGALYDGTSAYYAKSTNAYTLVTNLDKADYLDGYVAIEAAELDLTNVVDPTDDSADKIKVYVTDANGYTFVTEADSGANIKDTIYWARSYSDNATVSDAASTLKVLRKDFNNYYLNKTVYLRCAEGTNDAANLRIADVAVKGTANDFNEALTIVFVATSSSGESAVAVFENADPNAINGTVLFDKLLGNEKETITVDMYVYFDGEADGVKNTNIGMIDGQRISVEFAIDDQPYNK